MCIGQERQYMTEHGTVPCATVPGAPPSAYRGTGANPFVWGGAEPFTPFTVLSIPVEADANSLR